MFAPPFQHSAAHVLSQDVISSYARGAMWTSITLARNTRRPTIPTISIPISQDAQHTRSYRRVPRGDKAPFRQQQQSSRSGLVTSTSAPSVAFKKMPPRRTLATARPANFYSPPSSYEAVVVGAGPAGVTVLGNLLERQVEPILWVDPQFNGGRVNQMYREVPSNTNVDRFVLFGEGVVPFRKIVSGLPSRSRWEEPSGSDGVAVDRPDKLQFLREMQQDRGCELGKAADMILILTEGLRRTPGVFSQQGQVQEATLDEKSGTWTVKLNGSLLHHQTVETKRLILCHGAAPTQGPLPVFDIPNLHLDTALSPSKLSSFLSGGGPTTISVIGASHSAILVLRNLYNLAASTKPDLRVKWFTRHALRYAQFMDGWILRDNTGLKGEVADWARAHLEPEVFDQSDVSKYIQPISYEKGDEEKVFREHLPGSGAVVQAIGYTRNPLPSLKTTEGKSIEPQFDHETGAFTYAADAGRQVKLPGLYGAGIAWPERVVDPHGNVEHAVGFFKFMKFVKRVSPEWN